MPLFWDSPSFAENLYKAVSDFPKQDGITVKGLNVRFAEVMANTKRTVDNFKVQAWAYQHILPQLLPTSSALLETCRVRLNLHFGVEHFPREIALNVLRTLPMHCVMCVVKTWLNAWTTSHRMNKSFKRQCLFGCTEEESKDSLSHYAFCPFLLGAVRRATGISFGRIEARLGISPMSKEALLNVVILFTTYHTYRSKSRSEGTTLRYAEEIAVATHRHYANVLGV